MGQNVHLESGVSKVTVFGRVQISCTVRMETGVPGQSLEHAQELVVVECASIVDSAATLSLPMVAETALALLMSIRSAILKIAPGSLKIFGLSSVNKETRIIFTKTLNTPGSLMSIKMRLINVN